MGKQNMNQNPLDSPSLEADKKAVPLFESKPSQDYIEEWTHSLLELESQEPPLNSLSVFVFRLGKEWLALATIYCKEITHRRPVHVIPHRTGKVLQGIVNLNGELELYVALHELLQIETSIDFHASMPYQRNRMMAIIKDGEQWAFPVDEVDGIYKWNLLKIENVPVNVSKSAVNYIKGIMRMENKSVGLLDEELLFASLKRSIQ
jgi:chemotaxis-related protein WspD